MTRIRVSYGRTIQTAPYESLRLDVAIEKDVPEDSSVKEEADKSIDSLRSYVAKKITESITLEKM